MFEVVLHSVWSLVQQLLSESLARVFEASQVCWAYVSAHAIARRVDDQDARGSAGGEHVVDCEGDLTEAPQRRGAVVVVPGGKKPG